MQPPLERIAARRNPRSGRIAVGVLAIFATALFLWVVSPFWAPLLLAGVLAAVFQSTLAKLARALRGRRRTAGALITLGVLVVIVLPFASIATFGAREAISGFSYLRDTMGVQSVSDLKTVPLPAPVQKAMEAAHLTRAQLHDFSASAAERAQQAGPELLKESGRVLFHTVLMLLAFFFLLVDGPRVIRWLWNVSPLQAQQTEDLLREFHQVATGSIVGNVVTAVLQGVVAGVAFALFGVGHAVFFGMLVAVASFVPVIGTALIWVPALLCCWARATRAPPSASASGASSGWSGSSTWPSPSSCAPPAAARCTPASCSWRCWAGSRSSACSASSSGRSSSASSSR